MTKTHWIWLGGGLLAIVSLAMVGWKSRSYLALGGSATSLDSNIPVVTSLQPIDSPSTELTENTTEQTSPLSAVLPVELKLDVIVEGLAVPWDIVFTAPNRMLVTERPGTIRAIVDGELQPQPLFTFEEVDSRGEEGLMGMTLDPNYASNKYVYVCVAYPENGNLTDKVVRLVDHQTNLTLDTIILDDIPSAQFHAGCSVRFGPDQKLYISTGDARDKADAQNQDSLAGKILRLNADGSIPNDNPIPGSPVWSYGHRNPQGITWHPVTNQLWSSEHGPSLIDGPAGGDEINLIEPGKNYGWPLVSHDKTRAGLTNPVITFTPAVAPGSAHFYASNSIPQFQNSLLIGLLKGEGILKIDLAAPGYTTISNYEKLSEVNLGRIRAITTGPDGAVYFGTSNRDGRGQVRAGDDKIYRLSASN